MKLTKTKIRNPPSTVLVTLVWTIQLLMGAIHCSYRPLHQEVVRRRHEDLPFLAGRPFLHRRGEPSPIPTYNVSPASESDQWEVVKLAETDPLGASIKADAFPYVNDSFGQYGLAQFDLVPQDGNQQLPWNSQVPYVENPNVEGSSDGGWKQLPKVEGFSLNRTFDVYQGASIPFYQSENYDSEKIVRAVVVQPGKPRDCWKYTAQIKSALNVVESNPEYGVNKENVLLIGICWLNEDDRSAGSVKDGEIYFGRNLWQRGGSSVGPKFSDGSRISSYQVADRLLDWLFDKKIFPNLNQVSLVGHSLGAQFVQRYAMLKKTRPYDPNLRFWVGNPGSFVWPSDRRPLVNESCERPLDWPYGLNNLSSIPKYARRDVEASKDGVVQRFLTRKVHYAFALLDNGQGDTHCQSMLQGWNHLDRGCKYVQELAQVTGEGDFPFPTQTVDFVANTSHQDFPMMSTNSSLRRIFLDEFDVRHQPLTNVSDPGERLGMRKKKFATPGNEKASLALFLGSVSLVCLVYIALPFLFPPPDDYKDFTRPDLRGGSRGGGGGGGGGGEYRGFYTRLSELPPDRQRSQPSHRRLRRRNPTLERDPIGQRETLGSWKSFENPRPSPISTELDHHHHPFWSPTNDKVLDLSRLRGGGTSSQHRRNSSPLAKSDGVKVDSRNENLLSSNLRSPASTSSSTSSSSTFSQATPPPPPPFKIHETRRGSRQALFPNHGGEKVWERTLIVEDLGRRRRPSPDLFSHSFS